MIPNKETLDQLTDSFSALQEAFDKYKGMDLKLDMTRGKPAPEQLDLCNEMLDLPGASDYKAADGTDCRNYGGLDGIAEAKAFFAEYMGTTPAELVIGGNSSLALMHDTLINAMLKGVPGSTEPWVKLPEVKFLCPVPGYDRHFAVCEKLGIKMIPVDMDENGPDMAKVKELVASDASIKGIWCVPQYSNPTGVVYSDEVVKELATMETAATDFRVMWDNAYAVHYLNDATIVVANLLDACKAAGNPDRVFMYGSTSKISLAGAGIAVIAASEANIAWFKKQISFQTIGPDKINQLRHLRFFTDVDGLKSHMEKHADILKPKFDKVLEISDAELGGAGIATWSKPDGGYFISLDTPEGCASRVVALAAEAGVKMTAAGATFPYGKDPEDKNIRIAPSLPSLGDIDTAMKIFCICIKLAVLEKFASKSVASA
ncbi:aminotransferase class I/II-fold pyridoxal phosphate-dependent enzyme [Chondrinema litorale]|uniref:aminotransferase class I/II-fold pyridoxal phosphate-dependent enzyme n=1 Tax=Chondrinema litorale TaxID=2994555 RepID=UPI002542F6BA|nr:aminotransferase class I/II-fold pyridoxal phosphate-dependent enzyme [Chondrinema litorale]UZR93344.1 aminotransferase class I/II-fold pyridoxal phosphate-dependent enzyme [Chondrinema litorale]